ncbi:acetyl-CoA carboxylase biotin carboxyl carrier protein subunit [Archaeoglobales archaeon]|nr:MAG: acetyl-CoA carboxylase biotin carboxyl carrier protein subunit [Archaeoglobales archaeon]
MRKFTVKVDGIEYKVDVERIREGVYKVKIGDKTAEVTIEREGIKKVNLSSRTLPKETKVKTKVKESKVVNAVTAMLPGTIVKILVDVGEEVKAGQALLILEAMKMENEIVSPRDGVVKEIKVKEGMKVETGEVLMVVE